MRPAQNLYRRPAGLSSVKGINLYPLLAYGVAFSFGFFVQFNVMTATFGGPFLRLTDALVFLLIPCLFVMVGPGNTVRYGLVYLVALFLLVAGTILLKTAVEQGDIYLTLIFLVTSIFSFFLAFAAHEDERVLVWLAIGTLAGLLPSMGVLYLQGAGIQNLTAIGLGVPADLMPAVNIGTVKLGGIWSSGNESGHVYAVATASALYLALKFRRPFIYVAAYGLLLASFSLTLNRAGLIAPTIGLIYCYKRLGNFFLYVQSALVAVCALVFIASTSDLSGLDTFSGAIESRFLSDDYANANAAERLMSNIEGIKIVFENPFGIGYHERTSTMLNRTTSVESVHNGFLSLAYQSGVFVSILYILSAVYLLVQRRSVQSYFVIMFLYTASSMFFEEVNINPYFIFSITLTVAAAWVHYAKRAQRSKAQRRVMGRHIALGRRS
jgi:hypothetical protein